MIKVILSFFVPCVLVGQIYFDIHYPDVRGNNAWEIYKLAADPANKCGLFAGIAGLVVYLLFLGFKKL